jgi:hypothetical protein
MNWSLTFGINQMKHDKHGGLLLCAPCAESREQSGPMGVEIDSIDCVPDNITLTPRDPTKTKTCFYCGFSERYKTNGLTRFVRAKLTEHNKGQKAGRVRSLCPGDTDSIVRAVRVALKVARPDDVRVVVRAYGGIVPNSYRYPAAGDTMELTVDLTQPGGWRMSVDRGHAPNRSHGRGDLVTARLLRDAQTMGRMVTL